MAKNLTRILALMLALMVLPGLVLADGVINYLADSDPRPALGTGDVLEVHLINVASADCILLRVGDETMIIDSGIQRNYERITAYLQTIGVTELDYAFGSHPHDDHIGGFTKLFAEVPVGEYLKPRLFEQFESTIQNQLNRVINEKNIPVTMVENDTVMMLGDAKLTFMQWQNAKATQNNRSMILKVEYGERTILLTADIETVGQRALAEEYGTALSADIIKMPHHGLTPFTKELYEVVMPELATFSNVKDKIYEVLRTCEKRDIKWMLTTKGTMVMVTDGQTWDLWQIPRVAN